MTPIQKKNNKTMDSLRRGLQAAALCGLAAVAVCAAGAQQLVSIPFAGAAAGLPPGAGSAVCATATDAHGDGCPATQAGLGSSTEAAWTDVAGNIYIADFSNFMLRVVYHGGDTAAAIIEANNPTLSGPPQVGYMYVAGGTRTTAFQAKPYYCNGSSGVTASDSLGTGCPAYEAFIRPYGGDTDGSGNIFYVDDSSGSRIRVIYGGGAAVANLINIESGVTAPVVGNVYTIGGSSAAYAGDGGLAKSAEFNAQSLLVDKTNGDIYISDRKTNVVRKIDGTTGIVTAYAAGPGAGTCTSTGCTGQSTGDGGPATQAFLNAPYEVALDNYHNLFIAEGSGKRIRVVYAGGTLPGISNPVVGDIYTYAGGGTSTASGTQAQSLAFSAPEGVAVDGQDNVYVVDDSTKKIWKIDGTTGIGTVIAGGGSSIAVGAYCTGSTGPTATDTLGDGCPATRATLNSPIGRLSFDRNDVGYVADYAGQVQSLTFDQFFPDTAVGSTSTLPVAYTSNGTFTAPALSAGMQGAATTEFSTTPVSCTAGTSYAAGTLCIYDVQFAPALAGMQKGSLQAAATGSTTLTSGLNGNGLAPVLALTPSVSTSVTSAIAQPTDVVADAAGNLYVLDAGQGTVWKGTAGGTFTATALTGLSKPAQIAMDGAGNLYVADTGNGRVVELSSAGTVSTLVSSLSSPGGVVSNGMGILLIADTGNNRILRYDNGKVTVMPVTGLNGPTALALDGDGNLFIADTGNRAVVEFSATTHQTPVSLSASVQPVGLAVDAADDVYLADALSESVLKFTGGSTPPVTLASGLKSAAGVALDAAGDFFYTDSSAGSVTELTQQSSTEAFNRTNMGEQSATLAVTVSNIGNQALTFTSSGGYAAAGDTADFSVTQGSTACGTGLADGASCVLDAQFTPQNVGQFQETLTFPSNAANAGAAAAVLTGTGINLIKTTTSAALTNPANGKVSYGQNVTYTVTITPATTTAAITGSIVVAVDGSTVQTVTVAGATTTFNITFGAGTHSIAVTYSGDNTYASSNASYSLTVTQQATTTTLTDTPSLQTGVASLTLAAQVSPTISGTPTGQVTFYNGTTALATLPVNAQGQATYTTTSLSFPAYSFTAAYSGDSNYAGSTSSAVTPGADFSIAQTTTTLNAAAGYAVQSSILVTPYFGYTGTLTFSCSGLPAAADCRFQPTSIALSGTAQTVSFQIFTDVSPALLSMQTRGPRELLPLAAMLLPVWLVGMAGCRRRRGKAAFRLLVLLVGLAAAGVGLSGCGGAKTYPPGTTPAGTSTVVLTVSDAAGHSHAVSYQFTVY